MQLRAFYEKWREVILYLAFGVLTTVVGLGTYSLCFVLAEKVFQLDLSDKTSAVYLAVYTTAQVVQWLAAILFSFFTNRKWVFGSSKRGFLPIFSEFCGFVGGRIFTLLLQEALFFLFFDLLSANEYLIKISAAVLVVVLNYLISRFLIFRKKKTTNSNQRRPI